MAGLMRAAAMAARILPVSPRAMTILSRQAQARDVSDLVAV